MAEVNLNTPSKVQSISALLVAEALKKLQFWSDHLQEFKIVSENRQIVIKMFVNSISDHNFTLFFNLGKYLSS